MQQTRDLLSVCFVKSAALRRGGSGQHAQAAAVKLPQRGRYPTAHTTHHTMSLSGRPRGVVNRSLRLHRRDSGAGDDATGGTGGDSTARRRGKRHEADTSSNLQRMHRAASVRQKAGAASRSRGRDDGRMGDHDADTTSSRGRRTPRRGASGSRTRGAGHEPDSPTSSGQQRRHGKDRRTADPGAGAGAGAGGSGPRESRAHRAGGGRHEPTASPPGSHAARPPAPPGGGGDKARTTPRRKPRADGRVYHAQQWNSDIDPAPAYSDDTGAGLRYGEGCGVCG